MAATAPLLLSNLELLGLSLDVTELYGTVAVLVGLCGAADGLARVGELRLLLARTRWVRRSTLELCLLAVAIGGPVLVTALTSQGLHTGAVADCVLLVAQICAAAWLLASSRLSTEARIGVLLAASLIAPAIPPTACPAWASMLSPVAVHGVSENPDGGATWVWRIGPIVALLLGGVLLARRPGGDA